jgi:hypothetical protein
MPRAISVGRCFQKPQNWNTETRPVGSISLQQLLNWRDICFSPLKRWISDEESSARTLNLPISTWGKNILSLMADFFPLLCLYTQVIVNLMSICKLHSHILEPSLTGIGYLKGRLGLPSLKRVYSGRGLGNYISEVKWRVDTWSG